MRYLYAIAAFVLLFSASFLAYRFFPATTATEDIAIRINDRIITRAEFEAKYRQRGSVKDPYTAQPGDDFLQALITKELLIQEAKRLGLDQEEPFRQSVQNFYEQSLIKLLMERQYATPPAAATEAEQTRFQQLTGKQVSLAIAAYPSKKAATSGPPAQAKTMVIPFENLACEMKAALLAVEIGAATPPVAVGGRYETYRIAKVEEDPAQAATAILSLEAINTIIQQCKREKAMNDWLASLREGAAIAIHVKPEANHE